jgi:predicted DNA-binding protein (MmcQ/YjbR family)
VADGVPTGIRTRVSALKGPRPRPLDDGDSSTILSYMPRTSAGRIDTRPVLQRLRRLCLALPETSERASWGHPNFRAGKKTFAAFEVINNRPSIAFRLPPADVDELLKQDAFFVTPYGRGLWVSCWVDRPVNWAHVDQLLHRSYRVVALKRMIAALDHGVARDLLL